MLSPANHGAQAMTPPLGPRFSTALVLANELHGSQFRKSTVVPYVAHLLAVAALVIEHGGDEDEAIAALLHDAVEDQGGQPMLERIRSRFGSRVADIVAACSDADVIPKPPWQKRKEDYIASIAHKSPSALLVSLADKVHNARSIAEDLENHGDAVWGRFTGKQKGTCWYYGELLKAFKGRTPPDLWNKLRDAVTKLDGQSQANLEHAPATR